MTDPRKELVEKMALHVWNTEQHVGMFNAKNEQFLIRRADKMLQVVLDAIEAGEVAEIHSVFEGSAIENKQLFVRNEIRLKNAFRKDAK